MASFGRQAGKEKADMKANSISRKTAQVNQGEQHRSQTIDNAINEQIDDGAELDELRHWDWSKSWSELKLNEVLALPISEVASYCERVLDLPTLMRDLGDWSGRAQRRKRFCEYLGIGESTLSGWLKEQRVPRMAKEACVLLKTLLLLKDEVKRLKEQNLRNDVVIVQDGGRFQLVRFKTDNTGALMGTVIARDIPDESTARILAGSTKAFDTLKELRDYQVDNDSEEPAWNYSLEQQQLDYQLLRDSLAALGIEEWIKRFLPRQIDPEWKDDYRAWQILAEIDPARAQAKLEAQAEDDASHDVEDAEHQPNSPGNRGANGKAET
jgi:hypothetical protein